MQKDLYKALEIDPHARGDEIKRAFRKVALRDHPDRNAGDRDAEERFKEANHAYSILGDEEKRKRYDLYRDFRSRWAHLGITVPPSPVYEKVVEEFFMSSSIPGFAAGIPWNLETLARMHPFFSASRNSLLFVRRLVQALREERIFGGPRAKPLWFSSAPRKHRVRDRGPRAEGPAGEAGTGDRAARGSTPPP